MIKYLYLVYKDFPYKKNLNLVFNPEFIIYNVMNIWDVF